VIWWAKCPISASVHPRGDLPFCIGVRSTKHRTTIRQVILSRFLIITLRPTHRRGVIHYTWVIGIMAPQPCLSQRDVLALACAPVGRNSSTEQRPVPSHQRNHRPASALVCRLSSRLGFVFPSGFLQSLSPFGSLRRPSAVTD
jgi:hypothetical protein